MGGDDPATITLLRRWHAGDDAALDALLRRHQEAVRATVRKRLGPLLRQREQTDDFVQEVMIQVLRDGPRFQVSDDRHFQLLLSRIVENVIRDRHGYHAADRRAPRRERAAGDTILCLDPPREGAATPSQLTDQNEREAWVRLALELLDSDERRVIVARDWDGAPFAQIAAELNTTEDAARMRHQRALVRLSQRVGELRRGRVREAMQQLISGSEGAA